MRSNLCIALFLTALATARADTPANCTYDDLLGKWSIRESARGQGSMPRDCPGTTDTGSNQLFPRNEDENYPHETVIQLDFPNLAIDARGNEGTWTLIYNQGLEISINSRKYFAFSNWTNIEQHKILSRCNELKVGYSHDIFIRDWSCFYGRKIVKDQFWKVHKDKLRSSTDSLELEMGKHRYRTNYKLIRDINNKQSSWKAYAYPKWNEMDHLDILQMMGGKSSRVQNRPGNQRSDFFCGTGLPRELDWRNIDGINYVSPVRNQGKCGSCYAFASMAMLESRFRILTNNSLQPIFSPQDVLNCSPYSQGCAGGFPYLIAGKYAEDMGVALEDCVPYEGVASSYCQDNCRRYYATNYRYVGGFYGGCNEAAMIHALYERGPLAVGIEVFDDFMHYKGGVYHHTRLTDKINRINKWNPFYLTNHAVLVVGYGTVPPTGEKFWIVKNSWGADWGEEGYVRIRRGTDEIGIESMAVEVHPIPTY